MKAAVITQPGAIEITTIDDPAPGPREVVVAVAACGLCGTDLHILEGEFTPKLPIKFVATPVANCTVLPDGVRTEDAALIEPLSCAVHGYDILRTRLASRVLIYGAGTMGLMMLQLAKATGAASVDVVDINAERLATARQLGCSSSAASADELDRPTYGWDLVIDSTGNAKAIQDALGRVGKGSMYLQFGVADYATQATVEPYRIYNQEITITGSMAVLHSFERAADLFATGLIDPDVFISDRLPLASFPDAITRFQAGVGRKLQIQPGLLDS
ncbi:zinc-binding dehydrogenase [Streptomyces himalayensis]|uniref:2-deoxy-scyllo-inosamine dehydrogenase n=1 Tax=Streptomyces himalayensis subsp. himalayensis TaxID=2756131 RepID=A0A7W0DKZ9_9ACTN|nr:zinc-binding dehydrogenase [Streptomyces himalayensis]MBA2946885.1 zinc-binding dehydrogenase [Streptomyces himalayensis subsp. himalayensis]